MKTLKLFQVAIAVLVMFTAAWAGPLNTPSVVARTAAAGKSSVKSITSEGWNQKQAVRSLGVSVDIRFMRQPEEAYDVQCFFIAKDQSTKERYIYDVASTQSQASFGTFEFSAAPLLGSGNQWIVIPFSGSFSGTTSQGDFVSGSTSGTLTFTNEVDGSKTEGWIVRILSGGKVLKVESNQPSLIALATSSPKLFDAAITPPAPEKPKDDHAKAVDESGRRAVELYPDAFVKGSRLNNAITIEVERLGRDEPEVFKNPEWPLIVTIRSASKLGILPKDVAAKPNPEDKTVQPDRGKQRLRSDDRRLEAEQ